MRGNLIHENGSKIRSRRTFWNVSFPARSDYTSSPRSDDSRTCCVYSDNDRRAHRGGSSCKFDSHRFYAECGFGIYWSACERLHALSRLWFYVAPGELVNSQRASGANGQNPASYNRRCARKTRTRSNSDSGSTDPSKIQRQADYSPALAVIGFCAKARSETVFPSIK